MKKQSIFIQHLNLYQVDDEEYKNHVMIVTGAANGIGRALTLDLAKKGTVVIMVDHDEQALNDVYDEVIRLGGVEPVIFHVDLNTITQEIVQALVKQTEEAFSRLDGIVFCAAHYGANSPIEHYQIDEWNKTMKVNVFSTFLMVREFLPLLRTTKNASIIFTASKQARESTAYWGALAVAEKSLQAFAQILADETSNDSIEVFTLDPGEVLTRYMKVNYPGRNYDQLAGPDSVINAYCYLLSTKTNSGRDSGSHYYVDDGDLFGYD